MGRTTLKRENFKEATREVNWNRATFNLWKVKRGQKATIKLSLIFN